MGSSISLSVGENSIHIKEKPKVFSKKTEQVVADKKDVQDKWWLKKAETRLDVVSAKSTDAKMKQSPTLTSEVSSSMREFLEKEKMCKVIYIYKIHKFDISLLLNLFIYLQVKTLF